MSKENRVSDKRLAQMIDDANLQYLAAGFPDLCSLWQDRIDAFTELQSLRSKPVAGVEVKPLEWQARGKFVEFARTAFGEYTVEYYEESDGCGWEAVYDETGTIGYFPRDIDAKAAAEADYRQRILSTLSLPAQEPVHPDDLAVDRFAAEMKAKLAKKRAEGRGGWDRKGECTAEFLSQLLREHVEKGDPVDVGNLAMMLQQRGERITK